MEKSIRLIVYNSISSSLSPRFLGKRAISLFVGPDLSQYGERIEKRLILGLEIGWKIKIREQERE